MINVDSRQVVVLELYRAQNTLTELPGLKCLCWVLSNHQGVTKNDGNREQKSRSLKKRVVSIHRLISMANGLLQYP